MLAAWQVLLQSSNAALTSEPLASLGDSLALCRSSMSFETLGDGEVAPFGAVRRDEIVLVEVDRRGSQRRCELFAPSRMGAAIARLYERHAELLPDGPMRDRAAATARAAAALLGQFDLGIYRTGMDPDIEFVDHRTVGFPPARGTDEVLRNLATILESADHVSTRIDDVLELGPESLLVRWTTTGADRVSRGPFEWQFLRLCVFGSTGKIVRVEMFDAGRAEDALARLDELERIHAVVEAVDPRRAQLTRAFTTAFADRDWDALAKLLAPDLVVTDHRLLGWAPLHGPDEYIEALRSLVELAPDVRLRIDHLTMSDPRFLYVTTWVGTRDGGRFETPSAMVCELDTTGRVCRFDQYDVDQLEALKATFAKG